MNHGRILFCCVANSARSQMAEGLGRALAPTGVTVFSAGSAPCSVHSMALRALAEIGIDASTHASKGFADVPLETMDLVITLCADEVCPEIGGGAERLHWPLPDPAAVTGDDAAQLASFRSVRDEIKRRLEDLFSADRAAARP